MLPTAAFEQKVNTESSKATYAATLVDYTIPAVATDFFILPGSTSRKIKLTSITMSGAATAAGFQGIYLYKRTTPNTPGTTTATILSTYDTTDGVSSVVPTQALTNPSVLGTGVIVKSGHLPLTTSSTPGTAEVIWTWGGRASKCPTLNSASEFFTLSCLGFAVAAGINIHITVEWTEE